MIFEDWSKYLFNKIYDKIEIYFLRYFLNIYFPILYKNVISYSSSI